MNKVKMEGGLASRMTFWAVGVCGHGRFVEQEAYWVIWELFFDSYH